MSTLLRDAIATKIRHGMSMAVAQETYGMEREMLLSAIRSCQAHKYPQKVVDECLDRVRGGESPKQVAQTTGIPRGTIGYWYKTHGIRCKRGAWTAEMVATISRMWREGRTCEEIGAAIGVSPGTVKGWVQHHRDLCPSRGYGGARRTKRKDSQ